MCRYFRWRCRFAQAGAAGSKTARFCLLESQAPQRSTQQTVQAGRAHRSQQYSSAHAACCPAASLAHEGWVDGDDLQVQMPTDWAVERCDQECKKESWLSQTGDVVKYVHVVSNSAFPHHTIRPTADRHCLEAAAISVMLQMSHNVAAHLQRATTIAAERLTNTKLTYARTTLYFASSLNDIVS